MFFNEDNLKIRGHMLKPKDCELQEIISHQLRQ